MRIINKVRLFMKVNWYRTVYFNFRHLPYWQAIRLPILLYRPGNISCRGAIVIDVPMRDIKFGMLKFGVRNENSILTETGISISNQGKFVLKGSGVIGNGTSITIGKNGVLTIGKNFGITGDVSIHCFENVDIGSFFSCSWNVSIDDTDHHQLFDVEKNVDIKETKPIYIGNCVWLCKNVTIMKGSTLPAWTIVSSNSLVNKRFGTPPYSLLAGTPAMCIGKRIKRMDIANLLSKEDWNITEGLKIFNC